LLNKKNDTWYSPILIIAVVIILIVITGWFLSNNLPMESYKNIRQRGGVLLSLFGFLAMLMSGSKKDKKNGKTIWWVSLHHANWLFISGLVCVLLGFLLQIWGIS
jgi:membrane protease YdiL (CAAX protease family)